MTFLVLVLTLAAYGLAIWFGMRENAPIYVVGLLAAQIGALASPLWQFLYQFGYDPRWSALYRIGNYALPWSVFLGAWIVALPPLLALALALRGFWTPGYLSGLVAYALFVGYFVLVELIGTQAHWWSYYGVVFLPLGVSVTLLSALMNALVALGILSALLLARRYALLSLALVLLPMPLVLSLMINGLFGAPIYTVLLLQQHFNMVVGSWAGIIAMIGTLGLLAAGVHTFSSVIATQGASEY